MTYSIDDIRGLVKEDRVHRSIYTDPEIFELEMERIFERTWLYVGHDSLVPNPGDFYCVDIARQPVVMVRHTDGQVYVIYNRCGHRGTRVVNQESGNVKRFSCMYHGWTFQTDGALAGVPLREDEDEDGFDFTDPRFSMMQLPRVESYEGFVFASLSHEGPDLVTYIGDTKPGFDEIIAPRARRSGGNGGWLPPLLVPRQLEAPARQLGRRVAHASLPCFDHSPGRNAVQPTP